MEENENVVEETTQEQAVETVEESKFSSADDDSVFKVDLSKPPTDSTDEQEQIENDGADEPAPEQKEVQEESETQEAPALEEITDEEPNEALKELVDEVEEAVEEAEATGQPLPENIQKLVDFMNDTGGTLEDYVNLNRDYSGLDNLTLLREYYKQTKPHLNAEEIDFMMEDQFSFDEEMDEDRDIRRKKLALKEQVAQAKNHLESVKSNYYDEIKNGSRLTTEQQKAINFFNRYNKESEESKKVAEKRLSTFKQKTDNLFNDKFKGFEYNVGDKKYRFNVKNKESVKETQSDINNFIKKFLNEDNTISDAKGYHKSLYTAMNPDAIAQHFYEQGKADALKDSVAKSKNVSMNPRQEHGGEINTSGVKVRVVGESSSDFKFKINKRK
jgi:hypothetical protein